MPEPSARLGIPLPLGTDNVNRANRRAELEAIDANAAALGLNNQVLNKYKAAALEADTRTTEYTYNVDGNITQIVEKDGATVVKTTTYTYDANKNITQKQEVAGGTTVTWTYTYTDGNLTSITKAVA